MSQKSTESLDPFAAVQKVPLFTENGAQSSRFAVILDPYCHCMEVGNVSADYQLVPNHTVCEIATDVLEKTGYDYQLAKHLFDGKRFQQRWIIPEINFEPQVGDIVQVAVDAFNSYDGSTTFGLAFNAQRLVCSNGMVVDFRLGSFRFRHYGSEDFQEELSEAAITIRELSNKMLGLVTCLKRIVDIPIERPDIQNTFRELKLPKTYVADVFMALDGDNQWALYNAFTDVFTRQESFRAETWNRQVSRHFLNGN